MKTGTCKCGVISPRSDVGVKEIECWTARLLPSETEDRSRACTNEDDSLVPHGDSFLLNSIGVCFLLILSSSLKLLSEELGMKAS